VPPLGVVLLSHLLRVDTPAFAEREGLRILPNKEIKSGATTNNYTLMLPCHLGSHIDSPRHYYDTAKAPSDYDFSQYVFERPLLLEIAKGPGELIQEDDLKSHQKPLEDSDVALIRTGFQSYRETAPKKYIWDSPGLSSAAAKYLCGFRKLRALGIDAISITSPRHQAEGEEAHRILLRSGDFFIIEDMNLSNYRSDLNRVIVAPLLVAGIDSAPCTIIAEY